MLSVCIDVDGSVKVSSLEGLRRLQTFEDDSKLTTNSETRKPPYSSRNTDEQTKVDSRLIARQIHL